MNDLLEALQDRDNRKAYALTREIAAQSAASNRFYADFDTFVRLITSKSSYVRTRGFVLCCAQARWDQQGRLAAALPLLLTLLHDDKPTVVRQCLAALQEVALYRPELCDAIRAELAAMDLSGYRDSMSPLIQRDMDELLTLME